jgi:DeoR family fructose operon transcriptional repressor
VSFEFRFLERAGERAAQKEAIAEVAAGLVQPGQSVLLDSGTTTLAIARRLKAISRVTVVTTSLPIASELFGFEHIDLILLGGKLRTDAPDLTGALTEHSLEILRADIGFIGADAVGADGWLYNASAELGRMLRRLSASCTATYAVADSSKIGRHELMRFADLREWYGLITDRGLPADSKRMFQKMGIRTLQPKASTKARRAGSVSRQRV